MKGLHHDRQNAFSFQSAHGDDKLVGGEGNDIINAHDEPASKWEDDIDCGPGRDTVYFDKGFDKLRSNCEVKKPIRG